MVLASPAKLNLFFRVLRKRPDGYHEIASLFQAINVFDRLFFSFAGRDSLTCSDSQIPCDSSNLVAKALALFRSYYPVPPLHIEIVKKIPIQAGLGGGSSNAATTLWGLNELIGRPATLSELIQMGAQIGSDVPFFFSSGTAYCTGRGEVMEPFTLPGPLSGWLAKPDYGLPTPQVYQNTRIEELGLCDPRQALEGYPHFFNDLEVSSFRLKPELLIVRDQLLKSFKKVVMTGSGTTFFCLQGEPKPIEGVTYTPFTSINRQQSWFSRPK